MRPTCECIVAVAISTGITFGQQKPKDRPALVTVCEVLGNVNKYADADVAIVGRMERSVSTIDHYEFLSQDGCEHPVITHGHAWRNHIQILADWEDGMPKPPSDRPTLQPAALAAKLSAVRKTTERGLHREPRFDASGHFHSVEVPNEWAVVYGRIARNPDLNEDCGPDGCGGDDVPLVIIAEPAQIRSLTADGMLVPQRK